MRKVLLSLHLSLALVAGLFVVILGVTGSIMAFEPEIELLTHARLSYVTPQGRPLPLSGIADAVHRAYPGEAIDKTTTSKAIASYERTLISADSPFDHWLRGDKKAMNASQIRGFRLFTDPAKGNCAACHSAPNFTDNGFHNIGLAAYGQPNPDVGRFAIKPIASLKGAFKTPTLRDIALTAPYFHDGSATTLTEVVEHYNKGGVTKTDLSTNIKPLNLSADEVKDLVLFLQALTTPPKTVTLPQLPPN